MAVAVAGWGWVWVWVRALRGSMAVAVAVAGWGWVWVRACTCVYYVLNMLACEYNVCSHSSQLIVKHTSIEFVLLALKKM